MKIGIIDDDLVFSNILKKQIENSNYFCVNDIDIYNDDFQTIDIENCDFLFIFQCHLNGSQKEIKNTSNHSKFVSLYSLRIVCT